MNPIRAYFGAWSFSARLVFVAVMAGIGLGSHALWPVATRWHLVLGGFGCLLYLFGDFLTGSGFHMGRSMHYRYVGASTPVLAWRLAALMAWGFALAVFLATQPGAAS